MGERSTTSAAAADLCRNFGLWQDRAMHGPVLVTNHGRPRTVLISTDAYARLNSGGDGAASAGALGPQLLDHMAQGFVALGPDLVVRTANRVAEIHFQRSADQLRGARLIDLYPALVEAVKTRIFERVLRTGEPQSFEAPSSLYEGQTLKIDAFPYDGGVGYLFERIDDDLHTRAVMAEHDAVQAMFAAHGQGGTARLSMRGTFTRISDPVLALLGFGAEQLTNARLTDILPISRRVDVNGAIETVLGGGGAQCLDTQCMTRKGTEVDVTLCLSATHSAFAIDGMAMLLTPRRAQTAG
jgi:prevent-host-death family protein